MKRKCPTRKEWLAVNEPFSNAQKMDLIQIKLASIVVHVQELLSPDGRLADQQALIPLVSDPEILNWLSTFDKALLPVKRHVEPSRGTR